MSDFDLMISIAARLNDDRVSLQAEVDRQRAENEKLRAEIERLHNDAMRYRWLRKQKALHLVSDGAVWIRENGKNFRASHALSANNTRYGACETLDETIDEAMRGEIASKDADIERLRKALEAKP